MTTSDLPSPHRLDPSDQLARLDAAVDALSALGAEALAEDAEHGTAWGAFADWAYRNRLTALPATAATVQAWLDDDARALDTQDTVAVLDAIAAAHIAGGYPDPTGGDQ